VPISLDLRLDYRVLGFAAAVGLLTGVLAGLAPALRFTRANLIGVVTNGTAVLGLGAIGPLAAGLADALRGRLADPTSATATATGHQPVPGGGDSDYQRLWQALGHDPTGMDRLVSRTGLTTAELSSMLLVMELEGRVVVEHGRYSRKR